MNWDEIRVEASPGFVPYHNGSTSAPDRDKWGRAPVPTTEERKVIAWDMEGMNLSGDSRPQHPVIFGCSERVERPLVGKKLHTAEMLEYIIDVGRENPHAIHVGYGFRYDANMIVQDLPTEAIIKLYKDGSIRFRDSALRYWRLEWNPGKRFLVTCYGPKHAKKSERVTVLISDYSSFFAKPFIQACEELLRDGLSDEDREVIANGKMERGNNVWEDLGKVRYYWEREIVLMRRTFEVFRDVMCKSGFPLKDWYGPGALANFIIASKGMRPKMAGAQAPSGHMPLAVHEASKRAFFGGRFELFQAGRTIGPLWAIDINSAYPHALRKVPDLSPEKGTWVHVSEPAHIERFGFYRITYQAPNARINETRPMPLPWRDQRGMITFPASVAGWYASPEAQMMLNARGAQIHEGWYWQSHGEPEFPWTFLAEMYETRMRIGKQNLMSMPFKLGPNSIYGKLAQTVGWDKEKILPPKSHALPIAAWITSYCRSMLYTAMRKAPGSIVAVETDSIITTVDPAKLRLKLGDGLGEWEADQYDEIIYVQSGVYFIRKNGEWVKSRSRGLHSSECTVENAEQYLRECLPDENGKFPTMTVTTKPRFIGAGAANASSKDFKDIHCAWLPQERTIGLGTAGKRRHIPQMCPACQKGLSPWEAPHPLVVMSRSDGITLSAPRRLPWEKEQTTEIQELRDQLEMEKDQMMRE